MKKYLKMLPLILWPYAYLIWLAGYFAACDMSNGSDLQIKRNMDVAMIILAIYWIVTIVITIWEAIRIGRRGVSPREATKMNLVIKAWHIPAYVFHFIMGCMGMLMSIWGIGFIMFAIAVDVVTIFLSGIVAIGAAVNVCKHQVIKKGKSIWAAILSFIFCVDVVVAIALWITAKVKKGVETQNMAGEI